jgi:Alginate export
MKRWTLASRALAAAVSLMGAHAVSAQTPAPLAERIISIEEVPAGTLAPVEVITPTSAGAAISTATTAIPAAPATIPAILDGGVCAGCGGGGCGACSSGDGAFNFKKVPPVRPPTRTGMFPIPPSGKGAYNLLAAVQGKSSDGPPKFGYPPFILMPPGFFDADFRYLDDPKTPPQDALDRLKRIHIGDDWLMSIGGQAWSKYHNEYNSRLTQRDNTYNLVRARVYADLWYQDRFRIFVEGNTSHTMWQDLAPLGIDESRADIQNAFADIKLGDVQGAPLYLRAGRQELLLGSQRLISTLDWANTRRTFQGLRLTRTGEKWDFDAWALQPVIPNPVRLDSGDNNQLFAGAFATYRPKKGQAIDLYYMMLDNSNRVTQQGIARAPFTTHTIGSRYYGEIDRKCDKLLFDFEGAIQFGERGRQDIIAGMLTTGVGYHLKNAPLNPTFWLYYDYASGDDSVNGGRNFTTFNQQFPFGHFYMGWGDFVARQNIHDVNVAMYLYPTKWMTVWTQFHTFWLDNVRDGLYNVGGNAARRSASGRASPFLGHEIDLITNFHLTKRSDLMVSYAHLFGGGFLRDTAGPNAARNASTLTVIYGLRF